MAPSSPKEFLFVNQSLSSKPRSQREKELQDADRRAHAARHSRSSKPRSARRHRRSDIRDSPSTRDQSSSELPVGNQELVVRPKTPEERPTFPLPTHDLSPLASSTRLGQGKHDPFHTSALPEKLPSLVYDVLDYSYHFIWPSLSCADPEIAIKHEAARRQAARENAYVFHAQIAHAAGIRLRMIPPGNPTSTMLSQARSYHERKSLGTVGELLQTTTEPASDAMLLALTLLIWPAGPWEESQSKYPMSPLATAQNLGLYSSMELTPSMIQKIQRFHQLVQGRGGVDELRLPGQVHVLSFADIFVATRLGVRPLWPWPRQLEPVLNAFNDLALDPHAFQLSLVMGRGFSTISQPGLRRTLLLACRATLALDLHHRNFHTAPRLWELCPVRNAVQHQLCSLDPPSDLVPSHEDCMNNIVRLAALIYSDLVLFPISDTLTIKTRLAHDLRKALEVLTPLSASTSASASATTSASPSPSPSPLPRPADEPEPSLSRSAHLASELELITWCTTLGAIASPASTAHREWYILRLAQALHADPRLSDWILFQTLMSHFLWWDHVLQPRCWDVWNEAVQFLEVQRRQERQQQQGGEGDAGVANGGGSGGGIGGGGHRLSEREGAADPRDSVEFARR